MKKIILVNVCCFCCAFAFGQTQDVRINGQSSISAPIRVVIEKNNDKAQSESNSAAAYQTTSLVGGRWEFLMSEPGDTRNLKIDKFTGQVYILMYNPKDKTITWRLIEKETKEEENSQEDFKTENRINYQLFASGVGTNVFLLNTNTGLTWQLYKNADTGLSFWRKLE